MSSIFSTSACGVGTQTTSLPAWPTWARTAWPGSARTPARRGATDTEQQQGGRISGDGKVMTRHDSDQAGDSPVRWPLDPAGRDRHDRLVPAGRPRRSCPGAGKRVARCPVTPSPAATTCAPAAAARSSRTAAKARPPAHAQIAGADGRGRGARSSAAWRPACCRSASRRRPARCPARSGRRSTGTTTRRPPSASGWGLAARMFRFPAMTWSRSHVSNPRAALVATAFVFCSAGDGGPGGRRRRSTSTRPRFSSSQAAMDAGTLTSRAAGAAQPGAHRGLRRQGPAAERRASPSTPRRSRQARALDAERKAKGKRSPLHGIPVVLKDNFDTVDLPTTGGSMLLDGSIPPDDAFVVKKLRDAGAVILAKVNLSEFASGGAFSSLGGQTRNPHDPTRTPSGSSGGTGVVDRGRLRHARPRHRHRRLGARAVDVERHRRPEAHARAAQPRRHHPAGAQLRHRRADGAQRRRRGRGARRHDRRRRRRCRHQEERRPLRDATTPST